MKVCVHRDCAAWEIGPGLLISGRDALHASESQQPGHRSMRQKVPRDTLYEPMVCDKGCQRWKVEFALGIGWSGVMALLRFLAASIAVFGADQLTWLTTRDW